ncbi:MAG: efflux RND transporter periplasmic adaptor subunit [Planctomycetota bacterium]|jgi:Cu(I)/Ag(I) efflux system membrane fusion protein
MLVIAAFVLGYLFKGVVNTALSGFKNQVSETTEIEEEIWTCSMHPEVRLPKPGKCPKCGMDLIRAKGPSKTQKSKADKKYACAMNCLPPLPDPGPCPICGMQMVKVDEGVGRGDVDLGPRTLTLSPTARKLAEIQVAVVERKFVSAEIHMVGKVDYDETRLKYITAWVPGRLDRLYVDYTGVPVKKGEHLVYIYSPELLVAQVELLRAIETANELKTSTDESVTQSAQGLIEDARKKLRLWGLTEEQVAEIEKRGTPSDHITIYSPIGGIVINKNAQEGMYVNTGTRIYTIADLTRVWVKLEAYESDLAWLRYSQEVEFETEAYPGETFRGKVAFIDPVLDAKTRTVKVRLNVKNADGRLKPEMFIRAVARATIAEGPMVVNAELAGKWISPMHPEIIKDGPGSCDICGMPLVRAETLGFVSPDDVNAKPPLVIPASAPLMTGKRAVVYVEIPGKAGTYQGREIIPGPRAGDYYLVREGLTEGERVVVNGNFKIDSAIQIMAQPSMMNPEGGGPAPGHDHGGHKAEATAKHDAQVLDLPDSFRSQLQTLYSVYFKIHNALSLDNLKDAQKASKDLSTTLKGINMALLKGRAHQIWMKEAAGIAKSAANIAVAADIEKVRSDFALLSESMIAVAKNFGPSKRPVYRLHCPMAFDNRGADWLQDKKTTANPYFGSAMFRCGSIKETLGIAPAGKSEGGDGGK